MSLKRGGELWYASWTAAGHLYEPLLASVYIPLPLGSAIKELIACRDVSSTWYQLSRLRLGTRHDCVHLNLVKDDEQVICQCIAHLNDHLVV